MIGRIGGGQVNTSPALSALRETERGARTQNGSHGLYFLVHGCSFEFA
ncbi:hypothetical protein [Paenibacillus sp. IITD108]